MEDWRPDAAWTPARAAPAVLPDPIAIADKVHALAVDLGPADLTPRMDALIGAYAAQALHDLGARAALHPQEPDRPRSQIWRAPT